MFYYRYAVFFVAGILILCMYKKFGLVMSDNNYLNNEYSIILQIISQFIIDLNFLSMDTFSFILSINSTLLYLVIFYSHGNTTSSALKQQFSKFNVIPFSSMIFKFIHTFLQPLFHFCKHKKYPYF